MIKKLKRPRMVRSFDVARERSFGMTSFDRAATVDCCSSQLLLTVNSLK
jgi:hypothetical protein